MTESARSRWNSVANQIILALLGFLAWWAQDLIQTYRTQTDGLIQEQRQYRREIDDLTFRVKRLEMRMDALRIGLGPPRQYGDPLE